MTKLLKMLLIDVAFAIGKLLLDEAKKQPWERKDNNQPKKEEKV
jgi:hypothetical protein